MPALPNMELGPPPPDVPRPLPKNFAFRQRWSGNLANILGTVFLLFGSLIAIPMANAGHWLPALFPLLFAVGGFSMLYHGIKHAEGVLLAFRKGIAEKGTIASIGMDTTQSINGKHPWKVIYHFPVNGQLTEGIAISFDSTVSKRRPGQPVWVLYNEKFPEQNTLYPPIK